jgi:hypothetical protein
MKSVDDKLSDKMAIRFLLWSFPPAMTDRIIEKCGRAGTRERLLSPTIMVYFVLTMCLFPGEGYESVARRLADGIAMQAIGGLRGLGVIPSTAAVSRARQRLGYEPLKALFAETASQPTTDPPAPGNWYRRWRLWSLDGRIAAGSSGAAAPSGLRVTVLAESGTGRLTGAEISPAARRPDLVAKGLLCCLGKGDLSLADSSYAHPELWRMAVDTGADLLWEFPAQGTWLPLGDRLPDGSYLSLLPGSPNDGPGSCTHTARVIEGPRSGGRRLVTTILNPADAPAAELCDLYNRRWLFAQGVKHMNDLLRGGKKTMRSHSSEMIEQELWAHLLVYNTTCQLLVTLSCCPVVG